MGAAAVVAIVLGGQASMLPISNRYMNWYWPFLPYPMYSGAVEVGHEFDYAEAYVYPCESHADSVRLTPESVQQTIGTFASDLRRLARFIDERPPNDAYRAELESELLERVGRLGPENCQLRLWSQEFTVGPSGLELPGTWTLAGEWQIARRR